MPGKTLRTDINRLDKWARIFLGVALAAIALYLLRTLLPRSDVALKHRLWLSLVPGIFFAVIAFCWTLGASVRVMAAFILAVLPAPLLVLQEGILILEHSRMRWRAVNGPIRRAAKAKNISFDPRSPLEVVEDERRAGREANVPLYPGDYLDGIVGEDGGKNGILFGNRRFSRIVYCNELGFFPIVVSDEFGFINPRGILSNPPIENMIVGDSFAESACLSPEDTFAALLRQRHPKTVSLGLSSSGPLSNLAVMREFVPHLKPKRVFWTHFEGNDIADLEREVTYASLTRYLDPSYKTRLVRDWEKLQATLAANAEEKLKYFQLEKSRDSFWKPLLSNRPPAKELLKLLVLRNALGLLPDLPSEWETPESFRATLKYAMDFAKQSDAELVFVYLPTWETFKRGKPYETRKSVLKVVGELGLPLVDLVPAFSAAPNPLENYPFGERGHLTPESSRRVAAEIEKYIEKRNLTARGS